MSRKLFRFVLAFVFMLGLALIPASQAVRAAGPWYVATSGDDLNDCLSPTTPCATINGAIGKASGGDTIYVAEGTYTGTGDEVVLIGKDITLSGGWDVGFSTQSGMSTIDGGHARQGVFVNSNSIIASLDHFTIKNVANSSRVGAVLNVGILTIANSSIQDNHTSGIYNNGGNLTLINSTISNNTTSSNGGGINNNGNILTLNNATISDNSASYNGGGIYSNTSNISIQNSILGGNTAINSGPDCNGPLASASSGNNIISDTSGCGVTATSGDQFNIDPTLGTFLPVQGYHPILSGSPAIDTGNDATCLPADQRGVTRVGTCDIGAYEYTTPGSAMSLSIVDGNGQRAAPNFNFAKHLKVVALDSQGSPVPNVNITFTAPGSGASGTFEDSGTNTTSTLTSGDGIATASTFTANNQFGAYIVTASASGPSSADFDLENSAWFVSSTGSDSNSCSLPASPCLTINAAIGKALDGDTIFVATGAYTGSGDEVVLIDKDISLFGGWDATFTTQIGFSTVDGQVARRGVFLQNDIVTASLDHFTVENGTSDSGGGIYNWGNLILNNTIVSGNSASSYAGGGITNGSSGNLILNNTTISNNTASLFGGGMHTNGTVTLNNTSVSDNTAYSSGGGGIYNVGGLNLNNVTISGNSTSSGTGGGIHNSGNLTLSNVTISGNLAVDGGGIINYSIVSIQNSILGENTATTAGPDCFNTITSNGYNLIGDVSGCTFVSTTGDLVGTGASPIDPLLGPLQDNGGSTFTHALLPASPAIDAGNPAGCTDQDGKLLTTDQRGVTRPQGTACDIGAFELETGTIIINKYTTPASSTYFGFADDIAAPNTFNLAHGESITFNDVLPGTYAVTEDDLSPFYALTGLVCLDSDSEGVGSSTSVATRTATINLDPGETVECSFENDLQTGTIIINKFTIPASSTYFGFTDNIAAPNTFDLAHGESITFNDVLPGTYAVTEDDPSPFYALTGLVCLDSDSGSSVSLATRTATIDLDPGETIECSFENTLQPETGGITAHKFNDLNGNGVQDAGEEDLSGWMMTLYMGSGCVAPELASGVTDSSGNVTFSNLPAGSYSVEETLQAGWQNTTPLCQDVTLLPGGSESVSYGNLHEIYVSIDVKPKSCPNPLNMKSKGVLPVAILGLEDFDVTQIDPATIRLFRKGVADPIEVAPLRWSLEDAGIPYEPFIGKVGAYNCMEYYPDGFGVFDGYLDLSIKFKTQEVVAALGEINDGDVIVLQLSGNLKEEYGGTKFVGEDVVWILKK